MYTVCPKCALPLAVTAADLRAGQGYVRCGRCANVFNALLGLSDESARSTSGHAGDGSDDEEMERASATMSRPALPDPAHEAPKFLDSERTPEESEFYDPDITNPKIGVAPLPPPPMPIQRAASAPATAPAAPTPRPAPAPAAKPAPTAAAPRPGPAPAPKPAPTRTAPQPAPTSSTPPAPPAPPSPPVAPALRLIDSPPRPPPPVLPFEESDDEGGIEAFRGTSTFETIVLEGDTFLQTEETIPDEVLASEIADVSRRLAQANDGAYDEVLDAPQRIVEENEEPAPELAALREATGEFRHEANLGLAEESPSKWSRVNRAWVSWRMSATAVILALLFLLQAINHWRDDIATRAGWFGPMRSLSATLGETLHPNWDLSAYDLRQLGAAADSPDNHALRVRLSLTNVGSQAQALPLIRLTLLDRFGKAVSRGELEPGQYLPPDVRGASMIRPDQRIDTEVRVLDPSSQASSFELDVCVPAAGGGLRCAGDTSAVAGHS